MFGRARALRRAGVDGERDPGWRQAAWLILRHSSVAEAPVTHEAPITYYDWLRGLARDRHLSHAAVRVGVALTGYFNRKFGNRAWPSQATLAAESCGSERNVRRALAELEKAGHLGVGRRGQRQTNHYWPLNNRTCVAGSDIQEVPVRPNEAGCGDVGPAEPLDSRTEVAGATGAICPANPSIEPVKKEARQGALATWPEIQAECAELWGRGFVASYLGNANFDSESRTIRPSTSFAYDRLRRVLVPRWLEPRGLTLEARQGMQGMAGHDRLGG